MERQVTDQIIQLMTPHHPPSNIHFTTMRQQAVAMQYQEVALTVYKVLTQVLIAMWTLRLLETTCIKTGLLTLLLETSNTKMLMETTVIYLATKVHLQLAIKISIRGHPRDKKLMIDNHSRIETVSG